MTTAQANSLAAARRVAARRQGLIASDGSLVPFAQVPYEKQEAYTTELARVILSVPQNFDAQTLAIARAELTDADNPPLSTDTFGDRAAVFLGALADEAGSTIGDVAGVGEGVKSALNAAKWAIPVGLLILGGLYLLGQYNRAKRA